MRRWRSTRTQKDGRLGFRVGLALVLAVPALLLRDCEFKTMQGSLLVLLDHSTDCLRVWIDGVRWRPTVV